MLCVFVSMLALSRSRAHPYRIPVNEFVRCRRTVTIVCACVHGGVQLFGIVHGQAIDSPTLLPFLILIIIIFSGCYVHFFLSFRRMCCRCCCCCCCFFCYYFGSFKSAYMRSHVENTIFGKNGIRYERKQFMSKNNVCRFAIFSISPRCIPIFCILSVLYSALLLCRLMPVRSLSLSLALSISMSRAFESELHLINAFDGSRCSIFYFLLFRLLFQNQRPIFYNATEWKLQRYSDRVRSTKTNKKFNAKCIIGEKECMKCFRVAGSWFFFCAGPICALLRLAQRRDPVSYDKDENCGEKQMKRRPKANIRTVDAIYGEIENYFA